MGLGQQLIRLDKLVTKQSWGPTTAPEPRPAEQRPEQWWEHSPQRPSWLCPPTLGGQTSPQTQAASFSLECSWGPQVEAEGPKSSYHSLLA